MKKLKNSLKQRNQKITIGKQKSCFKKRAEKKERDGLMQRMSGGRDQ